MSYYQLNAAAVTAPPPQLPVHQAHCGQFISLQPLTDDPACFEELYQRSHGDAVREAIWDYMPYGPFADANTMRDYYLQMATAGDPQFYIVQQNADGACTGIMSYLRMSPEAYSIEIGHIWHAAEYQRGRSNSEGSYLLTANAFELGYRRMEWKCNALNQKSRQAALRLGFAFEGVFRQHIVFKGKNRDTAWFSIIDKDWQQIQENFKQWFHADINTCSLAALNRPVIEWSLPAHEHNG